MNELTRGAAAAGLYDDVPDYGAALKQARHDRARPIPTPGGLVSLDSSERAATAADLKRNLAASGLSADEVGAWLGLSPERLAATLAVERADPALVWYVRDALDAAVRDAGAAPQWTVLTDAARGKARHWFALRDVPPRP